MDRSEDNEFYFNENEISRYARHLSLPEVGVSGQRKLKQSSVFCVGLGGLGSPLLIYLAASGVGKIGIIDFDLVEESNLQRQIIHCSNSIGRPKTLSAKNRILEINPFCQVEVFNSSLNSRNALDILNEYDIICDCTDNFPSRYLINDACVILGKPNIYGSIQGFQGQATVFNLKPDSPNFRDLVPEPPPRNLLPTCSEGGVLGILPGIIGLIQATETIKIITNIGKSLDGRLLVFDALLMKFKELSLRHNQSSDKILTLIDYETFCADKKSIKHTKEDESINSISVGNLRDLVNNKSPDLILIDVREEEEFVISSIHKALSFPLSEIQRGDAIPKLQKLAKDKKVYLYCKTGKRSLSALKILNNYGIQGVNLDGGIDAWRRNL